MASLACHVGFFGWIPNGSCEVPQNGEKSYQKQGKGDFSDMGKNEKTHAILHDYVFILLGSLLLAIGINVFLTPNKISAGGITSLGTVLLYLFGVRMSVTNLLCNCVLFFFGFRKLGKYAVIQTASGIVLLSFFLELTARLPVYSENLLIASISGGVLMGLGIGFVVRQGASTGGSDFAGLILKRIFPHIPLAILIMVIDCAIVTVSGLIFRSFTVTFYSVLTLFVSSLLTDRIMTFGYSAKMVQIFSSHAQEITDHILHDFERGVTGIHCVGMFEQKESLMLECVVKPRELPMYLAMIRKIDKNAFVIIANVQEVLGEGFRKLD